MNYNNVQMEYLKTPVVNDTLYGAKPNELITSAEICLHSHILNFNLFDEEFRDYFNGRVVFDTAIPTGSKVQAEYSYKYINVLYIILPT